MTSAEFNERRLAANKKLLDTIEEVDPTDENAGQLLRDIAQLYHELNVDIRNEFDRQSKAQELKVERERIKTEADTKAAAIKAERERTATEAKTETRKTIVDVITKLAIAAGSIFAAISQIWMFKRSTEKEVDEALLTKTDQTIVQNGLSGRFFK